REHVHSNDNFRIRAVAEFANALKRAIDIGIPGDFLNEFVALIKNVAAYSHELIRVRSMREIVDGEDQDFRKATGRVLMLVCVFGNFLDNFAVAVRGSDVALDSTSVELALVFKI